MYSLICSITSYLAGFAFRFGFFVDTPFYIIIFLVFFPFNLALSMIAFFISTLAPDSKSSNTASYAIVLLAIVIESFVADNNLLTFIFTTNASTLVELLKAFLVIYPPFSYTKVNNLLPRSSQTLQFIQDTTSIYSKDHGLLESIHMISILSRKLLQDHCHLVVEHTIDTLI